MNAGRSCHRASPEGLLFSLPRKRQWIKAHEFWALNGSSSRSWDIEKGRGSQPTRLPPLSQPKELNMWLVRRDDNDSTPIKKPVYKESPILYGLPDGYNIATSFGDGGGNATMVKSGFFIGWLVGGGNRSEVYGKTWVSLTRRVSR